MICNFEKRKSGKISPRLLIKVLTPLFIVMVLLGQGMEAAAKVYLVAVGVNDYSAYGPDPNARSLRLPVADATAIRDVYIDNGDVSYVLLTDSQATCSGIEKAMKTVYAGADKDDVIVFFFSGHGYSRGFCAYDGQFPYYKIRKAMAGPQCPNKMVFADACRAGGMRENGKPTSASATKSGDDNQLKVMLYLASRPDESSLESSSMKNGFFTTWLIRGLKGEADANKDGVVTAEELHKFVWPGVVRISAQRQHPVMWGKFDLNMPVVNCKKSN